MCGIELDCLVIIRELWFGVFFLYLLLFKELRTRKDVLDHQVQSSAFFLLPKLK